MKKYKEIKIKNPLNDGYSVKLFPLQGVKIFLSKSIKTEFISVFSVGEFLYCEKVEETDNYVVYLIEQKYDMGSWSDISSIFLGNVVICRKSNENDSQIRLCLYCIAKSNAKNQIVTVINPEDGLIKIEPQQMVHFVLFDKNDFKWSIDPPENMKCIKCETVINDFMSVYDRDNMFCQEPRSLTLPINNNLKNKSRDFFKHEIVGGCAVTDEYHFWCCFDMNFIDSIRNMYNGNYMIGNFCFYGNTELNDNVTVKKMEVMLSLHDNKTKINKSHLQVFYNAAKFWNERSVSYIRNSIMNPKVREDIDISQSDKWFYIELPPPSMYFPKFDKASSWSFSKKNGTFYCYELKERYVNGKKIQRFVVSGLNTGASSVLINLGVLSFICQDASDEKHLSICFWKDVFNNNLNTNRNETDNNINYTNCKVEVELEIIDDGQLVDKSCITQVYLNDEFISYDEYYKYVEMGCEWYGPLGMNKKSYIER